MTADVELWAEVDVRLKLVKGEAQPHDDLTEYLCSLLRQGLVGNRFGLRGSTYEVRWITPATEFEE